MSDAVILGIIATLGAAFAAFLTFLGVYLNYRLKAMELELQRRKEASEKNEQKITDVGARVDRVSADLSFTQQMRAVDMEAELKKRGL